MPCSTSRANLSVFNSLRVILDTKTSECDWKFHLSTAPRAGEWAVTAGTRGQARRGQGRKTTAHIGESPEAYGVFHEVSRAEGPSQQSRKTTPHIGESPEAYGVFHEVSRAEGPSQQGRKTPRPHARAPAGSGPPSTR